MGRLTISLPDELHRALKQAAASRQRTIGELVAESLEFYGIKSEVSAQELLERARMRGGLPEADALELAVEATRDERAR